MTRQGKEGEARSVEREVSVEAGKVILDGTSSIPNNAAGIVVFAHGSGGSRRSPRNRCLAGVLHSKGIATLHFDLLTREEATLDEYTRELRFNIPLLAQRLAGATRWLLRNPETHGFRVGYFGASTGAAAALRAAAVLPEAVVTIVSRGGRPDLAGDSLRMVRQPALLIVGEYDQPAIEMNRAALEQLPCRENKLVIIARATHLFEEEGALEEVARVAAEWFRERLPGPAGRSVEIAAKHS